MSFLDNQLKGNWGEQFIAERLSYHGCLIRRVAQGHDSGIDLYCETIKEENPYLHFWCQVKTSDKYMDNGENILFRPKYEYDKFKRRDKQKEQERIRYWLNQPVPVFIFLVPDFRKKVRDENNYYICDAIDFYFNQDNTISPSLIIDSTSNELKEKFLDKHLPLQVFLWDLMNGKVSHLKTLAKEYTIEFPKSESHRFEDKLIESLRWTLRILSDDILFQNSDYDEVLNKNTLNSNDNMNLSKGKIYKDMLEILASNKSDNHYETYEIIGIYYELMKDFETALKNYSKSLEILSDPRVDKDSESWKGVRNRIDNHLQRISFKESNKMQIYESTKSKNIDGTIATHGIKP